MNSRGRIIRITEYKLNDTWNKVNNGGTVIQLVNTLNGTCHDQILLSIGATAQKTGLVEGHELTAMLAVVG